MMTRQRPHQQQQQAQESSPERQPRLQMQAREEEEEEEEEEEWYEHSRRNLFWNVVSEGEAAGKSTRAAKRTTTIAVCLVLVTWALCSHPTCADKILTSATATSTISTVGTKLKEHDDGAGETAVAFPPFVSAGDANGTTAMGFTIRGNVISNSAGFSISPAGDVNGDGFADVILSATDFNFGGAGAAYVIFGGSNPVETELNRLNGTNGFAIGLSTTRTNRAIAVSRAGDVNGDGWDDVVVGAARAGLANGELAELAHIIFGSSEAYPAVVSIDEFNGDNGGVSIVAADDSVLGADTHVAAAGDVNGDGFDDILVGDYAAGPQQEGKAHVLLGRSDFGAAQVLVDWTLEGVESGDGTGIRVDGVGDVNDDGYDDVVIGAHMASVNGTDTGRAYVVFGGANITAGSVLRLAEGNMDGTTTGFVLNGQSKGDFTGFAVSRAGDVNADGVSDLLVGAPEADPQSLDSGEPILNAGVVHVVYGSRRGFPPSLVLGGSNAGTTTTIQGRMAGEACGFSVAAAGDVNADGIDDVLIGAPQSSSSFFLEMSSASNFFRGSAYVLYGSSTFADKPTWNLQELVDGPSADGSRGFVVTGINAGDQAGWSVSSAGDVNGDGVDDFMVGALLAGDDEASRFGQVYVLHGRQVPDTPKVGAGTVGEAPMVQLPPSDVPPTPTCVEGQGFKIGFEERFDKTPLSAGQVMDSSVVLEGGVTFSVHRLPASTTEDGMIFDTRHPTGNDAKDLGLLPWQKNVLIVSKNGNSQNPNDFAHGGVLEARFPRPVRVKALRLLDIEEEGGQIQLYNSANLLQQTIAIPTTGNGQARLLWLNAPGVQRMVVTLLGSGALDDIFCQCVDDSDNNNNDNDDDDICVSGEKTMVDFKHRADGLGLQRGDVLMENVMMTPHLSVKAQRQNRQDDDPYVDATIYDAKFPTGQNPYLANLPWLRQMLIVSGNNNPTFPSPATSGGTIVLQFVQPVYLYGLRFINVETVGERASLTLLDDSGAVLLETKPPLTGRGNQKMMLLQQNHVAQVILVVTGSCAIDDILYCV